jgi:multidrug efflux pump
MFQAVPGGFIPTQDKLYLIGALKLPEGASLDRTDAVVRRMSELALQTEGVASAVAFPGLNPMHFNNTPNTGTVFFGLEDFKTRRRSAEEITAELNMKFSGIQEAFGFAFQPPAMLGIGTGSGYSLFVQDRAGLGYGELQNAVQNALRGARPGTGHGLPVQLLPVQRAAARRPRRPRQGQGPGRSADRALRDAAGVSRLGVRQRLQPLRPHLAGDRAGRRRLPHDAEGIGRLRTRNERGEMVPIGSMVRVEQTYGPDPGAALQRLPGRRPDGRGRSAPAVLGPGHGGGRGCGAPGAARGHRASSGPT